MEETQIISALGMTGFMFAATHIGLTQLVRQLACLLLRRKIQDGAAIALSLVVGMVVGPLFFQGLGPSLGLNHLPKSPLDAVVIGGIMAAVNSGLIGKANGFLKDAARYNAQAQVQQGALLVPAAAEPEPEQLEPIRPDLIQSGEL